MHSTLIMARGEWKGFSGRFRSSSTRPTRFPVKLLTIRFAPQSGCRADDGISLTPAILLYRTISATALETPSQSIHGGQTLVPMALCQMRSMDGSSGRHHPPTVLIESNLAACLRDDVSRQRGPTESRGSIFSSPGRLTSNNWPGEDTR